jgi:hypothetical protein
MQRLVKRIYRDPNFQFRSLDDKAAVIDVIFESYRIAWGNAEYIDWLANDLMGLVGYRIDLESEKDKTLWDSLNAYLEKSEPNIRTFLTNLPTPLLYAFVGVQAIESRLAKEDDVEKHAF